MTVSYIFKQVIILYNPNSTGGASTDARELKAALEGKAPNLMVTLKKTEYPGHAEEIGASYAKSDEPVLLVSASGDGGYNELINGVLKYQTKNVTVAVLPSGNANDHYEATKTEQSLAERIARGKIRNIDVISVEATKDGVPWQRYAHSYVGIGVTAYIGEKLAEADLNPVKEKWLLLKYLVRFGHVTAKVGSEKRFHRYSSVVVANIDRMSKVIRLDQASTIDDGVVELYETRFRSTLGLMLMLVRARLISLRTTRSIDSVAIEVNKPTKIQCDGEVSLIDTGEISISVEKRRLEVLA